VCILSKLNTYDCHLISSITVF